MTDELRQIQTMMMYPACRRHQHSEGAPPSRGRDEPAQIFLGSTTLVAFFPSLSSPRRPLPCWRSSSSELKIGSLMSALAMFFTDTFRGGWEGRRGAAEGRLGGRRGERKNGREREWNSGEG